MNARHFEVDPSGKLIALQADELLAEWKMANDGAFWIDVEHGQEDDLEPWLRGFDVPPLILDRCLTPGDSTVMIPLRHACYLEAASYADPEGTEVTNISIICLPRLIISLHSRPVYYLDRLLKTASSLTLSRSDISNLLVGLLLLKTNETSKISRTLSHRVLRFDELLDRDPDSVDAADLLDLKQAVSSLVQVSEEQEECYRALPESFTTLLDFSPLKGEVKLLTTMAASVNRRADRFETRLSDLRNRYQMAQQERSNHRLAILTVISAVFLPLTLLAGIWGMNFEDMPELSAPHGYFWALGFMALVGCGMTWLFYKRGWFG